MSKDTMFLLWLILTVVNGNSIGKLIVRVANGQTGYIPLLALVVLC